MRLSPILFVLALSFLYGSVAYGQAAPAAADADEAAKQAAVLDKVRAAYYHPGKIALSCDVAVDFSVVLAKIGDADSIKAMEGLQMHVMASDSKYAEMTFKWPPAFPADARGQVEGGAKQVVGGFFQGYWPLVNAEVVPAAKDHPTVVGAAAGGYTVTAAKGAGSSTLTVDGDGLIRRVVEHTGPGQDTVLTLSYTAPPNPRDGDRMRLTGLTVDRGGGSVRIQVAMRWDEQDVAGVPIPHRVTVSIPGTFDVPVTLTNCSVSPDTGAAAAAK